MRILKMSGKNFGQYKDLGPIYFPEKGTIGILGDNGSGKTTILSLIELALFGRITGKTAADIKYNGASSKEKWWVELVFELSGIQYAVFRHETTANASLKENGKLIQKGQTEVTEYITNTVLKMDQVDFSNAFYAKQDEFDGLNKLTNEKRKREISKLLRIDIIDKAISLSRADKNKLDTQIEEQKRYIQPESNFIDHIKELETKSKELESQTQKYKGDFDQSEKKYKAHIDKITELDKVNEEYQNLAKTYHYKENETKFLTSDVIPKLVENIESIKKETAGIPELKKHLAKRDVIEASIKKLESQKILYERKKFILEQKGTNVKELIQQKNKIDEYTQSIVMKDFKHYISEKEEKLRGLNNELEQANKDLLNTHSKLHLIKENGKKLRSELNGIEELGSESTCPVCKRGLGDHHDHLTITLKDELNELLSEYKTREEANIEKEKSIIKFKEDILKITTEIEAIKNEENSNKRKLEVLEIERNTMKRLKDDYTRIENELISLENVNFDENEYNKLLEKNKEMQEKSNQLQILNSKLESLPKLEENLKTNKEKRTTLNEELKVIGKKISDLKFDEEAYKKLKNETDQLFMEIRNNEKLMLESEQNLKTTLSDIKKVKVDQEKNNEIIISQNERLNEFRTLIYLDEVFAKYKIDKLAKLAPSIASVMQNLLSYLTNGKYDQVRLDDNYNIFVHHNGIEQAFHNFSGGEKKLFSLVQRLAISQIILSQNVNHKFDFLALDEVLGSMDGGRKENIMESLTKLSNVFKQIVMISHDQDINDLFDYTLIVEQNPDLTSRTQWSSEWDEESVQEIVIGEEMESGQSA